MKGEANVSRLLFPFVSYSSFSILSLLAVFRHLCTWEMARFSEMKFHLSSTEPSPRIDMNLVVADFQWQTSVADL